MKKTTKLLLAALAVCVLAAAVAAASLSVSAAEEKTLTMYMEDGHYKVDLTPIVEKEKLADVEVRSAVFDYDDYLYGGGDWAGANPYYLSWGEIKYDYDPSLGIVSFETDPGDLFVSFKEDYESFLVHTELSENIDTYINIDSTNFPDRAFKDYVSDKLDTTKDGRISTHEIMRAMVIECSELGITDPSELYFFNNAYVIDASHNELSEFDANNFPKLYDIDVSYNKLTELKFGKNNSGMSSIDCSHNELTSLDLTNVGYMWSPHLDGGSVYCSYNKIEKIIFPAKKLYDIDYYYFDCSHNKISELDFTGIFVWGGFDASYNEICSIVDKNAKEYYYAIGETFDRPVSQVTEQAIIDLSHNHLTELTECSVCEPFYYNSDPEDYIFEQTSLKALTAKKTENGWDVDLSELVSKKGLEFITSVSSDTGAGTYNPKTGIAHFEKKPETIIYDFAMLGKYVEDETGAKTWEKYEEGTLRVSVEITVDNVLPDTDSDTGITAEYPKDEYEDYTGVSFNAESITEGDDYKAAEKAVGEDYTGFIPYSLTLTDKDGKPVSVKSSMTVKVPVPEGWEAGKTLVFYVDGDGKATDMKAVPSEDGKSVTFSTTHFSTYVLVNAATKKDAPTTDAPTTDAPTTDAPTTDAPATDAPATNRPGNVPATGDMSPVVPAAVTLVLSAACIFLVSRRRKDDDK